MPSLWVGSFNNLLQFEETTTTNLPFTFTAQKDFQRLGKLAETLFCDWVISNSAYSITAENIQIIDQKQTIGELDVLLHHPEREQHIHLELITKFYLYNPAYNCNVIEAWIGPNRNDSLKNKIEKLKNKQLPLLYNEVTKKRLTNFGLTPEVFLQQVCFKAWLFVPLNFIEKLTTFNPNCIAGHYVTFSEFESLYKNGTGYFCPKKQDWLRFPETQKEWFTLSDVAETITLFTEQQQAIMVWTQYQGVYKRYIVVPFTKF